MGGDDGDFDPNLNFLSAGKREDIQRASDVFQSGREAKKWRFVC
jgi:hypothetical protein